MLSVQGSYQLMAVLILFSALWMAEWLFVHLSKRHNRLANHCAYDSSPLKGTKEFASLVPIMQLEKQKNTFIPSSLARCCIFQAVVSTTSWPALCPTGRRRRRWDQSAQTSETSSSGKSLLQVHRKCSGNRFPSQIWCCPGPPWRDDPTDLHALLLRSWGKNGIR